MQRNVTASQILEGAAAELARAADLVANRQQDERPYDVDGAAAQEADRAIDRLNTAVTPAVPGVPGPSAGPSANALPPPTSVPVRREAGAGARGVDA